MCNNSEIQRLMAGMTFDEPVTLQELKRKFEWNKQDTTCLQLAIEYKGEYIGDIDVHDIDLENKSAKFIIMIGYTRFWGQGFGTQAINLLITLLKEKLDLEYLQLEVFKSNIRALKCYKKLGFKVKSETNDELIMVKNITE